MGRKQFKNDLLAAQQKPPSNISRIELTDDGEITFQFHWVSDLYDQAIELKLLALDVDDYPINNQYMLFTDDSEADLPISHAFESLCPTIAGNTIPAALERTSDILRTAAAQNNVANRTMADDSNGYGDEGYVGDDLDELDEGNSDNWSVEDDDELFGFSQTKTKLASLGIKKNITTLKQDTRKYKSDLRAAKAAGFRVGLCGDPTVAGIVSVSVRISKLNISDDVAKAWHLDPSKYFVILIRFPNGYRDAETVREAGLLDGNTEIRVGLCASYKPSVQSAFNAFAQPNAKETTQSQPHTRCTIENEVLPLFIGQPLNTLFRERFSRILQLREAYALSWCGAELLFNDTQGSGLRDIDLSKYEIDDTDPHSLLPDLVKADTMSGKLLKDCSLPLLAMQFALRHFVRCTEFCLVCFCRVEESFAALRPFVCSRPLCFYQYLTLGFGPSIEWEVLSQPYVVDLLISFCYSQASAGKLRDFPTGINLKVPLPPHFAWMESKLDNISSHASQKKVHGDHALQRRKSFSARYSPATHELLFDSSQQQEQQIFNLHKGDYIAIHGANDFETLIHHRVEDITFPVIALSNPIIHRMPTASATRAAVTRSDTQWLDVDCYVYEHVFDELNDHLKHAAIVAMLDTLPSVKEMRKWLEKNGATGQVSLRVWRDRIISPAFDILRWIISSNRSCIMQIDTLSERDENGGYTSSEDRVSGMDEFMQFRFAQGAPDKEQRLIKAIETYSTSKSYPTIFAWHGSPLHNWHSIIREGLHFKETHHGRAFGHGVYMSSHCSTSLGYASVGHGSGLGNSTNGWPGSELRVASAVSLNEVVNAPERFVSKNPHYVVADIDWIQTRYLFVKTSLVHVQQHAPKKEIAQDPSHTAVGPTNTRIRIPVTALPKSRQPKGTLSAKDSKKRKGIGLRNTDLTVSGDDLASVSTNEDDRDVLQDFEDFAYDDDTDVMMSDGLLDDGSVPRKRLKHELMSEFADNGNLKTVNGCLLNPDKTAFIPGQLDMSNVRILPPPNDASRAATNALMKSFRALIETQESTSAHELGWYINPDLENMYQWIVELHSFDAALPLAKDMKTAGLVSIVVEMRFTNQFPFAPPFVRVVKPRFVPFNQGGGGHITDGGAICMELLTNDGWSAVSSIESVLLQVRLAMSEPDRPARLQIARQMGGTFAGRINTVGTYHVGEAMMAYERACRTHGWRVPEAFKTLLKANEG